MSFQKGFDELLNDILTDWQNQFPTADVSQGSLIFVKSACLASALWGMYRYQEHISRQIFPDTADSANLEHHAWLRNIVRQAGETDAELLARLLEVIRRPPAGGNKYDYVRWANECADVAAAYCYPLAQGDGTVDVVVIADKVTTGSEIPTAGHLTTIKAYIDTVRPVTHSQLRVLAPTILTQAVTMTCSGTFVAADIIAEITAYLNTLAPGTTLYRAQLISIAVRLGATNATLTVPAADVTPTAYQMIRPGVVSVA
jgi:uncharacterized phage protein gp47/JayE